jgi:hypothetical protein
MNREDFLRNLWRWKCGMPEIEEKKEVVDIDSLRESEWSDEFEELMRNRLVMGAIRYGKLHAPGKPQYDRIASIQRRLDAYREDGNKEHLVDVANIALCEFEECNHPNAHFYAIDGGDHQEAIS